ncbi:WhiB family transcriptional regulator [Nocardia mexicana]|uniref:WhiB family transcriptional regulator n=1 Tax=Nocardia mexicana TaxID=279262 RepID=UPI000A0624FA
MHWRRNAACRNVPPGLFYPPPAPKGDPGPALSYCRDCPVITECAHHTVQIGEQHGIFAGVWLSGQGNGAAAALRAIAGGFIDQPRCRECWRLVRPRHAPATEHPGTDTASEGDPQLCRTCGAIESPTIREVAGHNRS